MKNIKITEANQIFLKECFIKIITRAIKLGYDIIYIDESALLSGNNNYRYWRSQNKTIFFKLAPPKRVNLLLEVNSKEVIYHKINISNTNEDELLSFIRGLLEKISTSGINKYLIVLDNLSCHKTPKVINYFIENKINIVFNVTYVSEFNNVELCFRNLKRNIYLKLNESIEDTIKDLDLLLKGSNTSNVLLKNFKSTINRYLICI